VGPGYTFTVPTTNIFLHFRSKTSNPPIPQLFLTCNSHNIYQPTMSFHPFLRLPATIRTTIWQHSLTNTATLHIQESAESEVTFVSSPPGQRLACKAARQAFLQPTSNHTAYIRPRTGRIYTSTKPQLSNSFLRRQREGIRHKTLLHNPATKISTSHGRPFPTSARRASSGEGYAHRTPGPIALDSPLYNA
jgi:hypothetical protein